MSAAAHLYEECVTVDERFDCLEEYFISLLDRVGNALAKCSPRSVTIFVHNQSHFLGSSGWNRKLELLLTARHEVVSNAEL